MAKWRGYQTLSYLWQMLLDPALIWTRSGEDRVLRPAVAWTRSGANCTIWCTRNRFCSMDPRLLKHQIKSDSKYPSPGLAGVDLGNYLWAPILLQVHIRVQEALRVSRKWTRACITGFIDACHSSLVVSLWADLGTGILAQLRASRLGTSLPECTMQTSTSKKQALLSGSCWNCFPQSKFLRSSRFGKQTPDGWSLQSAFFLGWKTQLLGHGRVKGLRII